MKLQAALGQMVASRLVALAIGALGFAILGRLLSQESFGHFAIALAAYGLAEVLAQFGLRQRVISREEALGPGELAAASGLSLALAAGLAAVGLCAAVWGPVPEPVAGALVPLSLALLVGPFALGVEAGLSRALNFRAISVAAVVGVAAEVLVSVALAREGLGAAALGWGLLAARLSVAALLVGSVPRPARVWPRLGGWRPFLAWGGRMTTIQTIPKISDLAMIAGLTALQGAAVAGLFNRARTIHTLLDRALLEGIKPVVLPAFSDALRAGAAPGRVYRAKIDYLTAICWPGFALIALLAEDLVAVLLGPGWSEAVPAVRILALMGLAMPITKMSQKLFTALDATEDYLRIEAVREAFRVPLAIAGAAIGLEAFAAAFVAGGWIKAAGVGGWLHRHVGGPEGGYLEPALRAAALTAAALAGPLAVMLAGLGAGATLALALPLAVAGWALGAVLGGHPVYAEVKAIAARHLGRA